MKQNVTKDISKIIIYWLDLNVKCFAVFFRRDYYSMYGLWFMNTSTFSSFHEVNFVTFWISHWKVFFFAYLVKYLFDRNSFKSEKYKCKFALETKYIEIYNLFFLCTSTIFLVFWGSPVGLTSCSVLINLGPGLGKCCYVSCCILKWHSDGMTIGRRSTQTGKHSHSASYCTSILFPPPR